METNFINAKNARGWSGLIKLIIILLLLGLVLVTGCSKISEEKINELIDNKCLDIKEFTVERGGLNYSFRDVTLCVKDKPKEDNQE